MKPMQLLVFTILLALPLTCFGGESSHDVFGRKVPPGTRFTRIISLYPAHTENLVTLGGGKLLVGISSSDDYPQSIVDLPRFSYRDNPEKFIAAKPDLVLVRPMVVHGYRPLLEQLDQAGITVVSLQPRSVEELAQYWRQLGCLIGKDDRAEQMINDFRQGLEEIQARVSHISPDKRPGVYFQSIHHKMKTFSPQSIALFCLQTAGGRNLATDAKARRDSNIAAYSKEKILALAEDIDIFLAQQGRMNPVTIDMIIKESGFTVIKAVRNGRVHLIDEQLVSRPTMRLLTGMRQLQQLIYPQL